jgi:hypothetical protein
VGTAGHGAQVGGGGGGGGGGQVCGIGPSSTRGGRGCQWTPSGAEGGCGGVYPSKYSTPAATVAAVTTVTSTAVKGRRMARPAPVRTCVYYV